VPAELTFIGTATTLLEIGPFMILTDPSLDAIAERHGPVDAAVVHVGGTTLPGGFVVTMTGADAVECLRRIRPRMAIPVHYDDYGVFKSGLEDVRKAAEGAGLGVEMRYVRRGESTPL
jgi:L-ascorbate metabolism protein UlaG (beta-lactamase superfamily)